MAYITIATDMVLKRQKRFVELVGIMAEHVVWACFCGFNDDMRERIVNKDGKVVARYEDVTQ